MYDDDDYYLRECECGHREHIGLCNATVSLYYPVGLATPHGGVVTIVKPNDTELQRVDMRCACADFREHEGEQP